MVLMRTCLCGHDAADHHLDRMTVECWGELAYAGVYDAGFLIAHCDCRAYEPITTMTPWSLNPS